MEITKRFLVLRAKWDQTPEAIKACDSFSEAMDLKEKIERETSVTSSIIDLMEWCTEDGKDVSEDVWNSSSYDC